MKEHYLNDKKWSGKIKDYRKEYNFRCGFGRNYERYRKSESESDIEFKNMKGYENNLFPRLKLPTNSFG